MGELPPPYDPEAPCLRMEGFNIIYSIFVIVKNFAVAKAPDPTKGEDICTVQDLVSATELIKLGYEPYTHIYKD